MVRKREMTELEAMETVARTFDKVKSKLSVPGLDYVAARVRRELNDRVNKEMAVLAAREVVVCRQVPANTAVCEAAQCVQSTTAPVPVPTEAPTGGV